MSDKKKPTQKEKVGHLERAVVGINNILALYVDYNEDTKGFQRFLKEKMEKNKAEMDSKKEQSK